MFSLVTALFLIVPYHEMGKTEVVKASNASLAEFIKSNDFSNYQITNTSWKLIDGKKVILMNKVSSFMIDFVNKKSLVRESNVPKESCDKNDSNVTIVNDRYKAFLVKRQDKDKWVVSNIENENLRFTPVSDGKKMPWSCYLLGVGVGSLTDNKHILTEYSEEKVNDLLCVKAKVDMQKSKKPLFESVILFINPNKGYRIEKYNVIKGVSIDGEKTYSESNPLIMTKEVQTFHFKDEKLVKEYFIDYKKEPVDDKVFYLSNFGTVEPEIIKADNTIYLYLFGGAALLLMISLVLKK